ncbi:MAG: hypothetical protein U9P70_00220 [Patescibacteria group bacterium]|nr:hypothetical protein [Patescibacteria group bacterium]
MSKNDKKYEKLEKTVTDLIAKVKNLEMEVTEIREIAIDGVERAKLNQVSARNRDL